MTGTYLLTLHPEEPYFFGNEKTFRFDSSASTGNRYFIKGETMPLQTTLLGAMRYLLMPVKHASFRYTDQEQARNAAIIGAGSFDIRKESRSFGAILGIRPVFLLNTGRKYIRTPFDHIQGPQEHPNDHYTPFSKYQPISTDRGEKWIATDFNGKDGISDSFMDLDSGSIVPCGDIFDSTVRVGIDKQKKEQAFFKKQYRILKPGWSFGAYITLDLDLLQTDPQAWDALETLEAGTTVYLGQNKAAFTARLTEDTDTMDAQIARWLSSRTIYCFADAYVPPDIYQHCLFASTKLRDYRTFHTSFEKNEGRIHKGTELYKLLSAGSVLIPADQTEVQSRFHHSDHQAVGFNHTVSKTGGYQ